MRTYRLEIRLIQMAAVLAVIVLIAGFFGIWGQAGASVQTNGPESPAASAQKPDTTKIVALGDSFTFGYPLDQNHSWTKRLQDDLQVEVVNKGKKTQTSKDLLSRFEADAVAEKPGRVIIFAGIGDAIKAVPLKDVQSNIEAMVEKAKANHIIPILALPVGYPGAQQNIKEIRTWELDYAQQKKILTLDFSTVLMDADNKYLSGLSDGEGYPNAKGYETMGDYAARVLK